MDRRRFLATQSLTALALLTGTSGLRLAHAAGIPVSIAESEGHSWAVPFVADAGSLWAKNGLDASTTHFTSGRLTAEAVLAGKADFATTTDSVVALAALQGHKPVVFAEFANSSTQMLVAARKDKGVNVPADLRGKRIGTFYGSAGHFYLNQYLKLHGLTPKDVQIINLRPQEMVTALAQGSIDAFNWDWWAADAAAKQEGKGNVHVLSTDGVEKVYTSHFLLITNEQTAKAKPAALQAAVRALIDAEAVFKNDFERAVSVLAERTKGSLDASRNGLQRNHTEVQLAPRLIDDLVANAEWAIAEKIAQPPANGDLRALYAGLIDKSALAAVAPARVKL
ncbi:NrtA/SsuA/CpmA family ABC transporter substrate-binding protein [Achromobacter seleniivolatilans]|uniref:NrtA/SsuA/CpmA family ABC transporter substrate-binding protein n=1 Tax=Achromobacter seleniivolatilans TaxID=3047478 RepID=A0ABY9M3A0_9BURK|nr:NrtA/SsuA/CpmA family ABC transporter substrate-binding protein [Achromobacter sp. R39]WMD21488.1 NrtA/SsuA/CpmA family ABC transporter substrate-binding protein [Achromobacter sp. R39]